MAFETFKDFLTPKHFSTFGYIVAVLHILTGIVFSAVTTVFIARESGNFVCDVRDTPSNKDYVRLQCYEKYKEQYSPFPFFGFALLSFGTVTGVCIAYSFSVKSRIERMEAMNPDPENPRPRPPVTNRHRVFTFYSLHLALRLGLGIVFTVLQKYFYPSGFPTAFDCAGIKARKPTTPPAKIQNVTNSTDVPVIISCHMSSQNATSATGNFVINIVFVGLVVLELYHLGKRVIIQKNKDFTRDFDFCKQHLNLFSKPPPSPRASNEPNEESYCLEPLIVNSEGKEKIKLTTENIVDVLLCKGRGDKNLENWIERHEIPDKYLNPRNEPWPVQLKKSELFEDTNNGRKVVFRKVLIVGGPGIGKSVLCETLWQDWRTKALKTFEYFFLFQFKYFNLTSEKVSLKTLLRKEVDSDTFQDILDNPEKVLLVFDGLDEFMHHSDLKAEYKRAQAGSATEEMPFLSLYANLVKDNPNLLPKATVLTTCRPSVWQSLNPEWFSRIAEIMGYTEQTVMAYIFKFWKPKQDVARKIWNFVRANSILLFLCYIPVNCRIICNHLNWLISTSHQNVVSLPTRLTPIYELVAKMCIFSCDHECKGKEFQGTEVFTCSQEETLCKLGTLARKGIEEEQQMFREREVCGMENCGLLHRLPDSQISHYEFKENFCFIQLSLQKFLAARELAKEDASKLSAFIIAKASDLKWHLVIQFVAGLLHGQEHFAVDTFVSLLCDSLQLTDESLRNDVCVKQKVLLMMKCLHEYNNETTMKKAANELQNSSEFNNKIDLSGITNQAYQVTPFDCTAIVYFIKHLQSTVLNLGANSITDQGVSYLFDALSDEKCKLLKLDLRGNKITDDGVTYLCNALNVGNCTLQKLSLRDNKVANVRADSWHALMKSKLTTLDLSHNKIKWQGLVNLCEVLKDENCELKVLNLSYNHITDQGSISHLHDALTDSRCKLTKLYLSNSKINDHGVSQLCHALKHSDCNLKKLNLSRNNITAQGVSDLSDALKDGKCTLEKLYLGFNKVSDQCVSRLCGALTDKNCKLTKLNLIGNNTTDQGVSHLCEALKNVNNCHLVKLNLTSNNVTDHGVSLLCGALKDVNIKLTDVKVKFNPKVTNQGHNMLAEALQNKHSGCFIM